MPQSARIPPAVWEAQKDRIASLYVDQDKTLDEVIKYMAEQHDFHASKPQYIRKVTVNWKLRKNSKKEEWEHASALVSKRKAEGKVTRLMMNGKIISNKKRKKEMTRYQISQDQQIPTVPVYGSHSGSGPLSISGQFLSIDHTAVKKLIKSLILANKFGNMVGPTMQRTIPEPGSILGELVPTRHDLQAWLQPDESPWLQIFHSLIFLSTNNMLVNSNVIDQFLKSTISNGFLQDLKQILSITGPTVETFVMHLFFSSLEIESKDSLQFTRFLLQIGISPNSVKRHGSANIAKSALQVAVQAQNEAAVELLLSFKADPNEFPMSFYATSPLSLSLNRSGNSAIVEMLIDAGANVNFNNPGALHIYSGSPLAHALDLEDVDPDYVQRFLRAGPNPSLIDPWHLTTLHQAVGLSDLTMLDVLIEARADPNILCWAHNLRFVIEGRLIIRQDAEFYGKTISTPIQEAIQSGNIAIVKRLVDAGAILDNVLEPDLYNDIVAPLLSRWEAQDIVQILFEAHERDIGDFVSIVGANDCAQHRYLPSPLQIACALEPGEDKRQMIELLLSQGADINAPPAFYAGRTTLQAAAEAGDYGLVKDLLSRGANPLEPGAEFKGLTALQAAVGSGCIDVVDLLLSSIQTQLGLVDTRPIWQDGVNYLAEAAYSGDVRMLDVVLRSAFDAAYQCSEDHVGPALRAGVEKDSIHVVQRLLGASLNAEIEGHACSIICEAIWNRNNEIFKLLMDRFTGVNLDITFPDQPTPLWVAIHEKQKDMAQRLIEAGADVDKLSPHICPSDCFGREEEIELERPMRQAIGGDGWVRSWDRRDMVKMLVEAGADVNRLVDENHSPLLLAMQVGRFDIAEYLLRNGADPNAKGLEDGGFPIQVIPDSGMHSIEDILSIVRLLLEAGADVNAPPNVDFPLTPLQGAIIKKIGELADLFMAAGAEIHAPAFWQRGKTALQAAASIGNLELAKTLVAQGVDVNAEPATEYGATALQFAAIEGHVNMAIFLLENGALINAPTCPFEGRTALEGAAEHGRLDMIYLLLENDEDPDTVEDRCQDAAKFAEAENFPVIAKLLREYKRP
ncbi:hypothetical protein NW762_008800 [Fusarium torreyae]|uniref:Clr5 domain-containing protein n=1 Tax=Fusarium torreyae TaxID=1237075 RepID=A0A9W8RX48_9HYPO|nr:hypothetical protein NW762_008800 [Fusarium torreyae]